MACRVVLIPPRLLRQSEPRRATLAASPVERTAATSPLREFVAASRGRRSSTRTPAVPEVPLSHSLVSSAMGACPLAPSDDFPGSGRLIAKWGAEVGIRLLGRDWESRRTRSTYTSSRQSTSDSKSNCSSEGPRNSSQWFQEAETESHATGELVLQHQHLRACSHRWAVSLLCSCRVWRILGTLRQA